MRREPASGYECMHRRQYQGNLFFERWLGLELGLELGLGRDKYSGFWIIKKKEEEWTHSKAYSVPCLEFLVSVPQ